MKTKNLTLLILFTNIILFTACGGGNSSATDPNGELTMVVSTATLSQVENSRATVDIPLIEIGDTLSSDCSFSISVNGTAQSSNKICSTYNVNSPDDIIVIAGNISDGDEVTVTVTNNSTKFTFTFIASASGEVSGTTLGTVDTSDAGDNGDNGDSGNTDVSQPADTYPISIGKKIGSVPYLVIPMQLFSATSSDNLNSAELLINLNAEPFENYDDSQLSSYYNQSQNAVVINFSNQEDGAAIEFLLTDTLGNTCYYDGYYDATKTTSPSQVDCYQN